MIIGVVADTVAEAQQLLVEVTGDQAGCADTEQTDGARLDDAPGDAFHDLFVKQMVGHVDGRDAVVMYGVTLGFQFDRCHNDSTFRCTSVRFSIMVYCRRTEVKKQEQRRETVCGA